MPAPTQNTIDSPFSASMAVTVTPSDSVDLASSTRSLYVGGSGDVNVDMPDGGTVLFVGVQGVLPVRVRRVRATLTTATAIVALF